MVSPTSWNDFEIDTSKRSSGYTKPDNFSRGIPNDNYARDARFVPVRNLLAA
jgi:hypothetical protein